MAAAKPLIGHAIPLCRCAYRICDTLTVINSVPAATLERQTGGSATALDRIAVLLSDTSRIMCVYPNMPAAYMYLRHTKRVCGVQACTTHAHSMRLPQIHVAENVPRICVIVIVTRPRWLASLTVRDA
jgi:hypothetical protein